MSKRKLSRKQAWRIQKIQAERVKRADKKSVSGQDDNSLGPEQKGLVIANYGQNLVIEDEQGHRTHCLPRQNLGSIVVGDQVIWQTSGSDEGVVVAVQDRNSLLTRPVHHGEPKAVAANIDQVLIVAAPEPELQTALIDRYLVASELAELKPIIVINKMDLLTTAAQQALMDKLSYYRDIGYEIYFISAKNKADIKQIAQLLRDKTSILAGQSGVGKSSTIKSLLPDIEIQIGEISEQSRLGKHTTSASCLYHLPQGGAIIDSPGVRDFGLWQTPKDKITWGFREFRPFIGKCKFSNCQHQSEPGCAFKHAVESGEIYQQRLENFLQIMASHTT